MSLPTQSKHQLKKNLSTVCASKQFIHLNVVIVLLVDSVWTHYCGVTLRVSLYLFYTNICLEIPEEKSF